MKPAVSTHMKRGVLRISRRRVGRLLDPMAAFCACNALVRVLAGSPI